ncbi:tetratricopeptide repeat protein [Chthonobacter rhizosphaerae]|uniref:O-linked N-acetylglucosamine transferase, SPINDLY family protein n=1 Tax=Chthonobacter rhizosphaerae TaxID=2735553 RepID=UPI0015EF1B1A|nr:tetratricopeptide repeat protein [Chthonobacter rhizosphaerae]
MSASFEPIESQPAAGARALSPAAADRVLAKAQRHFRQGRTDAAAELFTSLVHTPRHAIGALRGLGACEQVKGNFLGAVGWYMQAVDVDPSSAISLRALAKALDLAGHLDLAVLAYERAVVAAPLDMEGVCDYAFALRRSLRLDDAKAILDSALMGVTDHARLYGERASVLFDLRRQSESEEDYRKACSLDPHNAGHWVAFGEVLDRGQSWAESLEAYRKGARAADDHVLPSATFYFAKCNACEWTGLDALERKLLTMPLESDRPAPPFLFLNLPSTPAQQAAQSAAFVKRIRIGSQIDHSDRRVEPRPKGDRIRVGYLSADFHQHATSLLMAGFFEQHDRSRFETFAYSVGIDDGTEMRQRVIASFDSFYECSKASDQAIVSRILSDRIDILVDLKGYTHNAREHVAAYRAAPIQVAYIGYPGPLAADFIDYTLVDEHIVPPEEQEHYVENLVYLPGCYQVNDSTRPIADWKPSRTDLGLPENAFVFACMNQAYKIKPDVFDVWMRILGRVPGSVLWLLSVRPKARDNLRAEAAKRGMDPDRIIFAEAAKNHVHLARLRQADLFLDTAPINAHTTASDALWAGLPLLTVTGRTFVGRVAGSLLKSVGMPDLITPDLKSYEDLAVAIATEPGRCDHLKERLAAARSTAPLFDTVRTTRAIERAYETMFERWRNGEQPRPFSVAD